MEASVRESIALKATPQLLIASDEQLSTSSLNFGRTLMDALIQFQGWNVSYCSVRPSPEVSFGQINSAFSHQAFRDLRHFLRVVAERVETFLTPEQRCLVVVTGTLGSAHRLVKALMQSGLRQRIVIVLHVRVHHVPLHPDCCKLFDCVDAIVTESTIGTNSVMAVYKDRRRPIECTLIQIPPGFDVSHALAAKCQQLRRRAREEIFGIEDDTLLIGCWLDRPDHRLGFTMHVFRILANSEYWKCPQCGKFNVSRLNPEQLSLISCIRCPKCHHENRESPSPSPKMHLHIMAPMAIRDECSILIDYREHMRLQQQVSFEKNDDASWSHDPESFGKRFIAFDIYFLPSDGAALHPSLQHASAAGTPIVTTAFGEAAEYFDGRVRLVRVEDWRLNSSGYLQAHLSASDAVQSLFELSRSLSTRQSLGQSSKTVTDGMQWEVISRQWADELRSLLLKITSERRVTRPGGP